MNPSLCRLSRRAAFVAGVSVAATAFGATIPYTNSFGTATGDGNFTNTSGFTRNSTAGTLTVTATGSATTVAYGNEQFADSVNSSYQLSTRFVASAIGTPNGDQAVGFGVFGLDATFTGGSTATSWIQASWVFASNNSSNAGQLRLVDVNGASPAPALVTAVVVDSNGATSGIYTANTTLTLQLTVLNKSSGIYDLTLSLLDEAGSATFGSISLSNYQARTAPTGGYYLGLRDRIPSFSGTTTLVHNDFVVAAIPEPSSCAILAGLGALGFAASRRRRA